MNGKSLGIIETLGFVPAVEAADTAVKSANVTLEGCRYVGAGLVSVLMTGDVGSVKASVDAAKIAAQRVGQVISVTVIARTAEGLETIVGPKALPDKMPEPVGQDKTVGNNLISHGKPALYDLKVSELRRLARGFQDFSIPKHKIKYSRKKDLIRAIQNHYRLDKE